MPLNTDAMMLQSVKFAVELRYMTIPHPFDMKVQLSRIGEELSCELIPEMLEPETLQFMKAGLESSKTRMPHFKLPVIFEFIMDGFAFL